MQHEADGQSSDDLYAALADLFERNHRTGEAIAVLEKARLEHVNHPRLIYSLAVAYAKANNPLKAVGTMKQLLSLEPENANALNFIGYTMAEAGTDLEEAEKFVKRALQLRPDSGAFTDSLGWVLYKRGLFRQAVEALQHAETLTPNEPVIIEHLGDALSKVARRNDAGDAYKRALELLDQDTDPVERDQVERKLKAINVQQAGN